MSYKYPNDMYQVGGNVFKKLGAFFKKSKLLSKIGSVVAPIVGVISPPAGAAIGAATAGAKMAGLGHTGRAPKALTKGQVKALMNGEGIRMLKSGGVSLAGLRNRYPKGKAPSNITPGQWRGLMQGRGVWGPATTINFSIGSLSRKGRGPTLPGRGVVVPGRGPTLPGSGVVVAGRGVVLAGKQGRGTKRGQVRKTARKAYVRKAKKKV
tara:strand:+ start:330 stop:956 length:627 start_codon:yes stop_codon:yes gene_type:complete